MARVRKVEDSNQRIRVVGDDGASAAIVIRGGTRAYLWVGKAGDRCFVFSGAATLRRFAHAILAEVGSK